MDSKAPKLLDRVRETLRVKHYSYRTEQTSALQTYGRRQQPLHQQLVPERTCQRAC
jgi:hypothetical protein